MKKGLIILVVAILAVSGLFIFSRSYRDDKDKNYESSVSFKTTTQEEQSYRAEGVIAKCTEAGIEVVAKDSTITLVKGDYTADLSYAYKFLIDDPPIFHYVDIDGDGKKETVMQIIHTKNDGKKYYALSYIEPFITSKGEKALIKNYADSEIWKFAFENYITCEFTQLENNKKFLQFAMANKGEKINYNEKTGITDSKHSGFAAAKISNDGSYCTLDKWSKGLSNYSIDKNGKITLDIQLLAQYKESSIIEEVGNIHCDIGFNKDDGFFIIPDTITFVPATEKRVCDPREKSNDKWSVEVHNMSEAPASDTHVIEWIESNFDVSSFDETKSLYFSEFASNIKYVDSITFTQDKIEVTAKNNYRFDDIKIKNQHCIVTAKLDGKKAYNISNNSYIETRGGRDVLVIKLDTSFKKSQMKDVSINLS